MENIVVSVHIKKKEIILFCTRSNVTIDFFFFFQIDIELFGFCYLKKKKRREKQSSRYALPCEKNMYTIFKSLLFLKGWNDIGSFYFLFFFLLLGFSRKKEQLIAGLDIYMRGTRQII